jgi:non-heme chloroperoxidase
MQSRAGFTGLGNPPNVGKAVSLTKAQFRHGFGNAIEQAESDAPFDK